MAIDPAWYPIISGTVSGAAGIVGALSGTALTQRSTRKREERQWERQRADRLREIRTQVFVDVAEYVYAYKARLDVLTGDEGAWGPGWPSDLVHVDRLTGRVNLHGPNDLRAAWNVFSFQVASINHNFRINPETKLKNTTEVVVDARRAIDDLIREIELAMEATLAWPSS